MTTATVAKGLVSTEVIRKMVRAMEYKNIDHIKPNRLAKSNPYYNEAITDVHFNKHTGNVIVKIKNSNSVILRQLAV